MGIKEGTLSYSSFIRQGIYYYLFNLFRQMNNQMIINKKCLIHNMTIIYCCVDPHCANPNILVCAHPQCAQLHSHSENSLLLIDRLCELINNKTLSINMLIERIEKYFIEVKGSILHEIQKSSALFKHLVLDKYSNAVEQNLRQNKFTQLNSVRVRQYVDYLQKSNPIELQTIGNKIAKSLDQLQSNAKKLYQNQDYRELMLRDLISQGTQINNNLKYIDIQSQIINQKEFLKVQTMLKSSKIVFKKWNLIYRASQHNFSSEKYYQAVNQHSPTLIILKTTNNRKFGAFLNLRIDKAKKDQWLADVTCLSFIFSLDYNETYKLKRERKYYSKAVYCGHQGPQIGLGCDLYIRNGCEKSPVSGSNLGGSYSLPEHVKIGNNYLAGQQFFQVNQYQVYQII